MEKVIISTEYITLGQFLKFVNIADSGGAVKLFLGENRISVNDILDSRRGKKCYPGDKIVIKGLGEYRISK